MLRKIVKTKVFSHRIDLVAWNVRDCEAGSLLSFTRFTSIRFEEIECKTVNEILTGQVMTRALQRYKMQKAGKAFQVYKRNMGDQSTEDFFRQKTISAFIYKPLKFDCILSRNT